MPIEVEPTGEAAGSGDMLSTNNLSDVASVSTSRDNLGLGTAATANTGYAVGDVPSITGGSPSGSTFLDGTGTWATPGTGPTAVITAENVAPYSDVTLSGLQNFDSVVATDGTRTFVPTSGGGSQVNTGVWVQHVGAWTRPADFDTGFDASQCIIKIKQGTAYLGSLFVTGQGGSRIVGTNSMRWRRSGPGAGNNQDIPEANSIYVSNGLSATTSTVPAPTVANTALTFNGTTLGWAAPSSSAPLLGFNTDFASITDRFTTVLTGTGTAAVLTSGLELGGAGVGDSSGIVLVDTDVIILTPSESYFLASAIIQMNSYDTGDNSTAIWGLGPSVIDDLTGNVAVFEFVQTDRDVVVNAVSSDGAAVHRTANVQTYSGGSFPWARFGIEFDPNSLGGIRLVRFSINGTVVATHTAHVPSSSGTPFVATIQNGPVVNGSILRLLCASVLTR